MCGSFDEQICYPNVSSCLEGAFGETRKIEQLWHRLVEAKFIHRVVKNTGKWKLSSLECFTRFDVDFHALVDLRLVQPNL